MTEVIAKGRIPYDNADDSRRWVETISGGRSADGKLRPNLVLRYATDTNFIFNSKTKSLDESLWSAPSTWLYNDVPNTDVNTKSVMNLGLPGQRVPNVLNWSVTETTEQVVQTASFECLNVHLPTTTTALLATYLKADIHSLSIQTSYVQNSLGTLSMVSGDKNVAHQSDPTAPYNFFEQNVKYRQFQDQTFTLQSGAGILFPDPAIPSDDDNDVPDDENFPNDPGGVGSYFVLIDEEVIRVYKKAVNTFSIRPGGRGVNGIVQDHQPGAKVTLLNIGQKTGEWVGLGWLNLDDYAPQKCALRPGTCLTSYEGYGEFSNLLYHDTDYSRNYQFTGYWFVSAIEPSFSEDGTAKVRVDLKNAGQILDQQKVNPDLVQRIKSKTGTWKIRPGGDLDGQGEPLFGSAGHSRDIPGDWVDFDAWDPSLPDSYPLKISVELAQHKEFFNHMRDTNNGLDCEFCQNERKQFIKEHPTLRDDDLAVTRSVGKHIYKQSIRVMNKGGPDGPLLTYIRLMGTLAAAAWEHPALGTDLAQRFTKIPARLYDNVRNIYTGLIFCGQIDSVPASNTESFDWTIPTYDDSRLRGNIGKLMCPFESTYDKAPFSQPMLDLADSNGCTFWVNREGYPVFAPRGWSLRPSGHGYRKLNKSVTYKSELDDKSIVKSWFLNSGSSINAYSHSTNPDQVLTQLWVTGTTAFDSTFTTSTSGTGWNADGRRLMYSSLGGNREGLSLTSGVQQVDTLSLDNQVFGLDWDTNAANWGVQQKLADGNVQVLNPLPPWYGGNVTLKIGSSGEAVTRVQKLINFFIIRRYVIAVQDPDDSKKFWYSINEDGKYGKVTKAGVKELQRYMNGANFDRSQLPTSAGTSLTVDGLYGRATYLWLKTYLDQATDFIKIDVWWYVQNGRDWLEYVAAVTGVPVPLKAANTSGVTNSRTSKNFIETPKWVIDDKGMQKAVGEWQKNYIQSVRNIGNNKVDDSINKASVRSISAGLGDPRIQPGDVLWCEIPGFLGRGKNPPYKNGVYVTNIQRQMDLFAPSYTATYSGYRYRSNANSVEDPAEGYQFIKGIS